MPTRAQLPPIILIIALIAAYTAIEAVRLHVWNSPLLEVAAGCVFVGLVVVMVVVGAGRRRG